MGACGGRQAGRQAGKRGSRQAGRQAGKQASKQTKHKKESNKQTSQQTHTHTCRMTSDSPTSKISCAQTHGSFLQLEAPTTAEVLQLPEAGDEKLSPIKKHPPNWIPFSFVAWVYVIGARVPKHGYRNFPWISRPVRCYIQNQCEAGFAHPQHGPCFAAAWVFILGDQAGVGL